MLQLGKICFGYMLQLSNIRFGRALQLSNIWSCPGLVDTWK